ncbi:hypothetical protein BDF22DRAFT_693973 [Syncephalis plumigaleata]|nr:hypothetical protein BDF22DRAFT_693973 [Syncephalis plumigaleata]
MEKYRAEINELRGQLGLESLPPCSADESTATLFDPESTWNTSIHSSIGPGGNDSPSSFTSSTLSRRVGAGSNNSPGSFASSTMSRRISVMSTASKASDIFFDAEEDIILADDSDSESGEELSDIDNDDDDDDDEGMIERVEEAIVGVVTTTGGSIVGRRSSVAPSQSSRATGKRQYQRASRIFSDANQVVNEADDTVDANAEVAADATQRRVQLPAPTCETEISFLSLLRKNIGKDLRHEQADSLERLLFISAFVVSGYASTQYRSTRKPFNPLHGETYECVREDKGFKFISEKVSHNPPIMACHAESENFIFHQDSKLKSKFWVHITLPKWNEQYTYCKPATWMRNMLAGNRYLEHSGEVRVQNHTTGEYCLLNFKEGGMFSASTNEVIGHTINGRWTEIMYHEREKNQLNVLWRAEPPPANHEAQYGFTTFTVQLNELTPDLQVPGVLPITDTRLRPDQRAYEEGRVDEADALKAELEDAQRQRRRQMEASEPCWQYTGGYWETREKRQFNAIHQLW